MFSLFNRMICGIFMKNLLVKKIYKLSRKYVLAMGILLSMATLWAADVDWSTNITDYAIKNTVGTIDISDNITITTLNVYNRPNNSDANTCVIDLKGHTLNITNLKIGAYSLIGTRTSGSVKFIDSVGGGTVNVTKLDATAYYYEKHLEVSSPVTLTITTTLNTNAGGNNYSFLELTGDGEIVIDAAPTDTGNVTAKDVTLSGSQAASITRTVSGTAYWNGSVSDDWFNPSNWTGISAITDLETISRIEIPGGFTRYPIATGDVTTAPSCALVIGAGGSCTFKGKTSLNTITMASNATLESHDDLTISSMTAPTDSILKFNQGAGAQTTTIGGINFYGASIDFGNDAGDVFNMGATGDGALDLRSIPTVKLAGTINSSNLTLNDSPSLAANTILPKVTLASDTAIAGTGYTLQLSDSVDSDVAATPRSLTVTAGNILAQTIVDSGTGPKIGAVNKLKDITFNCDDYEGKNGSDITCSGDIHITGTTLIRGDILANKITIDGETQFLGVTSKIETVNGQVFGDTNKRIVLNNDISFINSNGGSIISFRGDVSSHASGDLKTLTASANQVIFSGNAGIESQPHQFFNPLKSINITGKTTLAKSLNTTGANTFNGDLIISGTASTITSDNTVTGKIQITGAGTTTFTGENSVTGDFICTQAGKTLIFPESKTQTVNGKFTITGTSANPVTLKSSTQGTQWTINTPVATADVTYAKVQDSKSVNDSIKAISSFSLGNNTNWNIAAKFNWVGTTSTDWTTVTNWKSQAAEGTWIDAESYPGQNSEDDIVTVITTAAAGTWPEYDRTTAITLDSITVGDATHTDSAVKISNTANIILKNSSSPITNNGTVIFQSSGRFIDTTTPTANYIIDTAHGTVEYSGSANQITNFGSSGADDYNNLVVKVAIPLESGHQIKVGGDLTTTSDITAGGQSIYVQGKSSIGGNITTAHNQEYNGAVTFTKAAVTLSATAVDGGSNPYRVIFDNTITGITAGTALEFEHVTFKTATTFTNIKTLTVNGTTINNGTITTSGTQTYTGLVTNSGTINVPSLAAGTTAMDFQGGYNGTGGTLIGSTTTNPDILFAGGSEVTFGTLTQNSDVIKFTNSSAMDFTPGTSTYNDILFNGTGTVSLKGDLNAANLTLNSGSSLAGGSYTITLSENWNNAGGTFTPGTSTVKLSPSGTKASVSGDTTFYNLTSTVSGKTLEFEAGKTQTVTKKFTVTGTTGTGNQIALKSSAAGSQWTLSVNAADKVAVSNATLIDSNSTFAKVTAASSLSLGNNTNWDIAQNFVWKTTAATDNWKTPANWQVTYNGSNTDTTNYPGELSNSDSVAIPQSQTNPDFKGGESDASITLSKLTLSQANSKLTLSAAADIKLSDSTPLSNTGTIIYSSTGRIKNNAATPAPIMDTAKGTVQYDAGAAQITEIGTADYFNLVVNGTGHTLGGAIAVGGTFTLSDNGTITNGTSLSVTGTSSIGGTITTTGNQTYSQKVTLTQDSQLIAGTNKVTLSKGAESKTSTDKKSLTIGNSTNSTQLDTGAALSNLNDLTVWGYFQANSGAITCDGDITFKSDTIFRGAVTGKTLTVDGKTTVGYITATIKTTNGDQTFNDIVSVNTETTHKKTAFLAGTNTVHFNKGITAYRNAGSGVVAEPDVTIGSDTEKTNVSIDHDAGTAALPLTSLTVYGTTTLGANTKNILTTGPQTYTDAVTFAADLTLNSTGNDTITVSNNFTSTPVKNVTIENGKFSQFTGTFTANDLTVKNSSTFNFGTGAFTAGTLTVTPGASFTQTGDNTTNTQKVTGLVNKGTMVWDSASQGGTLTIGTDGITDSQTDATLVVFNNKNLTIDASSISGIFYNLTIPASKTITNGYKIVVRNNFTINGTYTHNDKPLVLGTFKIANAPNPDIIYTTGPAGAANNIITSADNSVTQNLGTVTINQGVQSKDIKFPVNFTTLTCDDTTTDAGEIKFEKALTVTNAATLKTKGTLSFATTSTDASAVTTEFTAGVSVTQAAKVNIGGTFNSTGETISIASPVELTANSAIQTTGKNITFTKSITNASGKNAELTITTNLLGTATTGDISLGGNITVKKLTLENPHLLTFTASSISAKDGFTLNGNGNAKIGASGTAVTISTTDSNILFDTPTGTVNLLSNLTLDTGTGDGDITLNKNFTGTTTATEKLTLTSGSGNITVNSNLGTTALHLGNTTLSGNNITVSASKEIYTSKVSVTNTGLLRLTEGSKITADTGFTKTGTGLSQIATTITTTASPVSFNTTTYIDGTTTINAGTKDITIGTATTGDLYISAIAAATPKDVKFTAGTLDVKGNIALFNGNISLNADMTAGKDIILLNGTAATMYKDDDSGVTNLYDYHNPLRTALNNLCPPSLVFTDPATGTATASKYPETMPDTVTEISHNSSYISTLKGFAGKKITAGQNFYDNGVDLSENSDFTIAVKENDSAKDSFAEIYNANIKHCKVECTTAGGYAWITAETCTDNGNNQTEAASTLTYNSDGSYNRTYTGIAFLRPRLLKNNNSYSASEGRKLHPEIPNFSGTYSVRDNVIRVEFVRSDDSTKTVLIENSNNEISQFLQNQNLIFVNTSTPCKFETTAYIDAECTDSTDGKGDIAVFYLKADSITWNLTATGTFPGSAADVDANGIHQNRITDLKILRALNTAFASLTDEHKNRIKGYTAPAAGVSDAEGFIFTATATRCAIAEMHITFTVADFENNKIYMYFDQPLADNITWRTFDPSADPATEDSIHIIADPGSASYVNSVTSISRDNISPNGIILNLSGDLDYTMLQHGITIKYGGSFLFNNKIHSPDNKVVVDGESHCITDVLINAVDVQYAYDNRNDAYIAVTDGADPDSIATRDFTGEGRNNKVFAEKDITLVTSDISDDGRGTPSGFTYRLVADITPAAGSDGTNFESYSGHKTRFWFPGANAVTGYSPVSNSSANIKTSTDPEIEMTTDALTGNNIYLFHNFPEATPCLNWAKGSNVRFMFEVLNGGSSINIDHKYDHTEQTPLYAVRLKNPLDPTTIDLWSFLIAEPQRQRGGVSIYSNVVNATNKEFCTLEVNMPRDGNLRVIVMTADGNVVKYLENGRQTQGLHYYYWNGTNNSGSAVARGIYFIRVVGPEIEETRKVMIVK